MKKIIAVLLVLAMVFSFAGCGKSEAVKNVEALIAGIGEVSLDNEAAISDAEAAYEALPEEEKADVATYAALQEARASFNTLKEEKEREEAIANVEKLIAEMGEASLENASKIEAAKKAYDALSEEDRAKVKDGDTLDGVMKKLESLKKDAGEKLLNKMTLQEDRVRGLKFYYPEAFDWYGSDTWAADLRSFILPYIGRDNNSAWLRIIYNYTGDDWVFYKSIIAAVDGKQYYKSFNYFDIVHDNEAGDVWEYIDDEATEKDIEMLWAIANSDETIVRFQGDNYSYDYTVSASDKQSLKDTLNAYAAIS